MQEIGFPMEVALTILALATMALVGWLVMRFAGGTHHRRKTSTARKPVRDHAVPASDPCPQRPPAALFFTARDGRSLRFDLTTSPVRVGRDADNDMVIPEGVSFQDTASRHHAWLYYDAHLGQWAVEDPGSLNGTYVDGVRTGHNVLRDGTWLAFGGVQALFRTWPERACLSGVEGTEGR
jgi:hypothetical protein